MGRRRKGKQQLRIDEARKYEAAARELADCGDVGAIAAMVPLYLGTRASEVMKQASSEDLERTRGESSGLRMARPRLLTRGLQVPPGFATLPTASRSREGAR